MSDTLVFFSTHYINREEKDEEFLFRSEWIEEVPSPSGDSFRKIFCLKDAPTVFGRKALYRQETKSNLVRSDLVDDVTTAWDSLGETTQTNIQQIYLFIHANELANTYAVGVLSDRDSIYKSLSAKLEAPVKIFSFRHRKGYFTDHILRYQQPLQVVQFIKEETNRFLELQSELSHTDRTTYFNRIETAFSNLGILPEHLVHVDRTDEFDFKFALNDISKVLVLYLPSRALDELEAFLSRLEKKLGEAGKVLPILMYGKHNLFGAVPSVKAYIDPRYRYLDASIWFRYLSPLSDADEEGETFSDVISQIASSVAQGADQTVVAQEYREFSWRLFQNAHIKKVGEFSGHASAITPFSFHSETAMSESAKHRMEEIKRHKIKWDALLVDDYANTPLRSTSTSSPQVTPNKEKLIRSLLPDVIAQLDVAKNVEEAKGIIDKIGEDQSAKVYDLILLDYLFSREQEDEPVYGTQLLADISEGRINHGKAANFKYWVFPVSVFSEALASDLQDKGIQYQETHWVLARGADPVNTPQLFRAALLEFLQLQYDGLAPAFSDLARLWLQHPIEESQGKPVDPRRWARRFNTVLAHHFGKSDTLSYKSSFTESASRAFKLDVVKTEELSIVRQILELLKRLIYNLGFSSIFDHDVNATIYKQMYLYCTKEMKTNNLTEMEKDSLTKELHKLGEGIFAIHNTYD